MAATMAKLNRLGTRYSDRSIWRKWRLDTASGRYTLLHYLAVPEHEVESWCVRIAKYLQVNQEEAVWWSKSYSSWLKNDHE